MHIPENWGFVIFTEDNHTLDDIDKKLFDVDIKQTTYALFREVMFGNLNYLRELSPGSEIKFESINFNEKELISTFKKTKKVLKLKLDKTNFKRSYLIKQNGILQKNEFLKN